MNKICWIIEQWMPEDEQEAFNHAAKQFENTCLHLIDKRDYYLDQLHLANFPEAQYYVGFTSLRIAKEIIRDPLIYPGVFCNLNSFKLSNYLSMIPKQFALNPDYKIMPAKTFLSYLNGEDLWFVKSDAGDKRILPGTFRTKESFSEHLQSTFGVDMDWDIFVAKANETLLSQSCPEYRFFVWDEKIVAGSQYYPKQYEGYPQEAFDFAQNLIQYIKLEPRCYNIGYVIDVVDLGDNEYKLVELNSYSCSGHYKCDPYDILRPIWEYYK